MGDLPMGEEVTADLYEGVAREKVRRTRPGTPMRGVYSINQMDDFYVALAAGQVKTSGVMNYIQRLYIAERCLEGATVTDVCCGRGLQLPVLYKYAAHISSYVGLDIVPDHIAQARARASELSCVYNDANFSIEFAECDVSAPWPEIPLADVMIYTSALEHLPKEQGAASLRCAARGLAANGVLYLSTPNTKGEPPRLLQHGVHVYEWSDNELREELASAGLRVVDSIGLLPPSSDTIGAALESRYGPGAAEWYARMAATVPAPFLGPVVAAALSDEAAEVMYVCKRV